MLGAFRRSLRITYEGLRGRQSVTLNRQKNGKFSVPPASNSAGVGPVASVLELGREIRASRRPWSPPIPPDRNDVH
jgi:hypothetical protein